MLKDLLAEWTVPFEIDQLRVVKLGPHTIIGLPESASWDLERNVRAAVLANDMRLNSVDYTKRRYLPDVRPRRPRQPLHKYLTDIGNEIVGSVTHMTSSVAQLERIDSSIGAFAAGMALARLEGTFRTAVFLSKQGYFLEPSALGRVILEQIAWAFAVRELIDQDAILSTKATTEVTALRRLIPYAGMLYGVLSDHTHVKPAKSFPYIETSQGRSAVVLADVSLSAICALNTLLLADAYTAVYEVVMARWLPGVSSIAVTPDGSIRLKEDRPLWQAVAAFARRLAEAKEDGATEGSWAGPNNSMEPFQGASRPARPGRC